MRWPVAIYRIIPHLTKTLALPDNLPRIKPRQRLFTQMPIKRIKNQRPFAIASPRILCLLSRGCPLGACLVSGNSVLQNNRRPIILMATVIGITMDGTIERRIDRRAGGLKEIDGNVDGAPGRQFVGCYGKEIIGVYRARFVVTANAHSNPGRFHFAKEPFGKGRSIGRVGQISDQRAAKAQVKDEHGCRAQILVDDRCKALLICLQPGYNGTTVRHRWQATSPAQAVMGEVRLNRRKLCQQGPGRRFADRKVVIFGL